MTWIALADHRERRFSLRGLGIDKQPNPVCPDDPAHLLTRGSLMLETRLPADARPQVLFGYSRSHPAQHSLVFQAIPGNGISMVQVQGDAITHAAIKQENSGRTDVLRITYSWDSDHNWGRLTLERPEDSTLITADVPNPRPLPLADVRDLMLGHGQPDFAQDVVFAALSNQIEPIGPSPSMTAQTPIAQAGGYVPLGQLRRGDTVLTQGGDIVPVLHMVTRRVPARGSFAPVRLRAPYFGLQDDVIVAPDQRMVIDGPEVNYLFDCESVLAPARHLVNGFAARDEPAGPFIDYSQLILPAHDTIFAAGAPLESMHIGRTRRDKLRHAASIMHHLDASTLPEHGEPAHKVLRWFEAITLAKRRAA
ncbi:MAG: Hint domain-containing protein [Sulfitobacter sp.]